MTRCVGMEKGRFRDGAEVWPSFVRLVTNVPLQRGDRPGVRTWLGPLGLRAHGFDLAPISAQQTQSWGPCCHQPLACFSGPKEVPVLSEWSLVPEVVKMEEEIGAKPPEPGRVKNWFSPRAFGRSMVLPTVLIWAWGFQDYERTHFWYFIPHSFWKFVQWFLVADNTE